MDAVRQQINLKATKGKLEDEKATAEDETEEERKIREEQMRAALKAKARGPPKLELQGEEFIF